MNEKMFCMLEGSVRLSKYEVPIMYHNAYWVLLEPLYIFSFYSTLISNFYMFLIEIDEVNRT